MATPSKPAEYLYRDNRVVLEDTRLSYKDPSKGTNSEKMYTFDDKATLEEGLEESWYEAKLRKRYGG